MEVHWYTNIGFELGDDGSGAKRVYESGHILKSYDFSSKTLHFFCLFNEILIGENLFRSCRFASEDALESGGKAGGLYRFFFGINGVANCAISDATNFIDHLYGVTDVVDIVESVEDTHHVKTIFDGFFVETFEHGIWVRYVTEKVASTRKGRKVGDTFECLAGFAKSIPGGFIEVAHHRVRNSASPYFHDVEFSVAVERKESVDS